MYTDILYMYLSMYLYMYMCISVSQCGISGNTCDHKSFHTD